jgi:hypothetical protein
MHGIVDCIQIAVPVEAFPDLKRMATLRGGDAVDLPSLQEKAAAPVMDLANGNSYDQLPAKTCCAQ